MMNVLRNSKTTRPPHGPIKLRLVVFLVACCSLTLAKLDGKPILLESEVDPYPQHNLFRHQVSQPSIRRRKISIPKQLESLSTTGSNIDSKEKKENDANNEKTNNGSNTQLAFSEAQEIPRINRIRKAQEASNSTVAGAPTSAPEQPYVLDKSSSPPKYSFLDRIFSLQESASDLESAKDDSSPAVTRDHWLQKFFHSVGTYGINRGGTDKDKETPPDENESPQKTVRSPDSGANSNSTFLIDSNAPMSSVNPPILNDLDTLSTLETNRTGRPQFQDMVDTFLGVLRESMPDSLECDREWLRKPTIQCGPTSRDTFRSFFDLVNHRACQITGTFRGSMDVLGQPFLELIRTCGNAPFEARAVVDPMPKPCVDRSNDGARKATSIFAGNAEMEFNSPPNQNGWASDYSENCGVGIVIHSGDSDSPYSTPTFTLRDGSGSVVFEGLSDVPIAVIASALVVDCSDNIITVIAAMDGTVAEFHRYDFDLASYTPGGPPIRVVSASSKIRAASSSIKGPHLVSDSTILYAPVVDDPRADRYDAPPSLRMIDWKQSEDLGIEIRFQQEDRNVLEGSVWNFDCADDGRCFMNTIRIPGLASNAGTGRLFSFLLSDIMRDQDPPGRDVVVTVKELTLDFSVDFSALSLEAISSDRVVACTMSGYAFAAGALAGSMEAIPSKESIDLQDIASSFQLGNTQECNLCDGGGGGCSRIGLEGQKRSSGYVWAVEECGGKIYAGTLDQSYYFGRILSRAMIEAVASYSCGVPRVQDFLCGIRGCPEGVRISESACRNTVETTIVGFVERYPGLRGFTEAYLAGAFFSEKVSPSDFGFDLFSIDRNDLEREVASFRPVTLNGFRGIAPSAEETTTSERRRNIRMGFRSVLLPSGFDPASRVDDGVRSMVCHVDPVTGTERLVIASAILSGTAEASSTYTVNTDDECDTTTTTILPR